MSRLLLDAAQVVSHFAWYLGMVLAFGFACVLCVLTWQGLGALL